MRTNLNCPKCGAAVRANLPDKALPDGWLIHQSVTCGKCGHQLTFQDGGSPTPARPPVTVSLRVHVFSLKQQRSGEVVGTAVVCLDARYASLRLHRHARIERRQPTQWRAIRDELASMANGVTLDRGLALAQLLSRDLGETVTVTAVDNFEISVNPLATAAALDGLLTQA